VTQKAKGIEALRYYGAVHFSAKAVSASRIYPVEARPDFPFFARLNPFFFRSEFPPFDKDTLSDAGDRLNPFFFRSEFPHLPVSQNERRATDGPEDGGGSGSAHHKLTVLSMDGHHALPERTPMGSHRVQRVRRWVFGS
jgi:hypothetical protein